MKAPQACARKISELLGGALAGQPRASIAVSGGNAPAHFPCQNVHRVPGQLRPGAIPHSVPGEPSIDDHRNLAGAVYVEKFRQWSVTLLSAITTYDGEGVIRFLDKAAARLIG
jgi:hypothetical protein